MKIGVVLLSVFFVFLIVAPALADQVDDLVEKSKKDDFNSFYFAILDLGKIKEQKAVDALIKILREDPNPSKRSWAAQALASSEGPRDPRAVPALIEVLETYQDPSLLSSLRADSARSLGAFKDPRAIEPLLKAVKDSSPLVRWGACDALGNLAEKGIKDPRAFDALLGVLGDSDPNARAGAATALAKYQDLRALVPLIELLKDPEGLVRGQAAYALGMLGDPKAVPALRLLLQDPDPMVRDAAAFNLYGLGASGEKEEQGGKLREALDYYQARILSGGSWDVNLRKKIIEIVGKLNPPPAISEEAQKAMASGKVEFEQAQSPGELIAARNFYQRATDLAPWWPDAYFNLALAQEKMGKYADAISNLNLYLEAAPTASDAQAVKQKIMELEHMEEKHAKARDLLNQAADLNTQKRFEEAVPLAQEAIRIDPNYALPHANLGLAYFGLKRYPDALPELKEAIRLGYRGLGNYWTLAQCYEFIDQNYDEAIRLIEEGLKVDFNYHEKIGEVRLKAYIYETLGFYYEKKNNRGKAVENYELAIREGHPDSKNLESKIEQLKK